MANASERIAEAQAQKKSLEADLAKVRLEMNRINAEAKKAADKPLSEVSRLQGMLDALKDVKKGDLPAKDKDATKRDLEAELKAAQDEFAATQKAFGAEFAVAKQENDKILNEIRGQDSIINLWLRIDANAKGAGRKPKAPKEPEAA